MGTTYETFDFANVEDCVSQIICYNTIKSKLIVLAYI